MKSRRETFILLAAALSAALLFASVARGQLSSGYGISAPALIKYLADVVSPAGPNTALGVEMQAPQDATSSPSAGGLLTATTTYYYVVTALDGAGGETLPSGETSALTTSANRTITVSWTAVAGATKYRVYQATSSNGYLSSSLATITASASYADATTTLSSGAPPSTGTAYYSKISSSTASWVVGGKLGVGTSTPAEALDVNGYALFKQSFGSLVESTTGTSTGSAIYVTSTGVFYGWQGASSTLSVEAGAGYATSTITAGATSTLTIGSKGAGTYQMFMTITLAADAANQLVRCDVFKNGTASVGAGAQVKLTTANDVKTLASVSVVALVAGDTLDLRCADTTAAGTTLTLDHASLVVSRIGK